MRRAALALAVLLCTGAALAQPVPPSETTSSAPAASPVPADVAQSRIDAMLRSGKANPAWFADSFLKQIPVSQVDGIVAQLTNALGAYQGVGKIGTHVYITRFEKGSDEVDISLDGDGKIDGLLFRPPSFASVSLDDALHRLGALPNVSYALIEGTQLHAGVQPDKPMAVGSSFKLAVLAALRDQIAERKRRWDDVIQLDPAYKSLPSGALQSWPDHAPLTISTVAIEMISVSDNTAADMLRALVWGPDLDRYALRNRPFLSTRALFVMKADTGSDLLRRWQAARSLADRDTVLREAQRRFLPKTTDYPSAPRALDVEWIYTTRELCGLMSRVADLPLMSVNPGVAEPSAFRRVAYKGGSEPGVLNLTTSVVTNQGRTWCLSATVNDPVHAINETSVFAAVRAVVSALATK